VPIPTEAPLSATTLVLMRQLIPYSVDIAVGSPPDSTLCRVANHRSKPQKTQNHNTIGASLVAQLSGLSGHR
jgi:hypothetical protein